MLGVQPQLGRLLVPSDDDAGRAARGGASRIACGSASSAAIPAIVGKTLTLRGLPYTIVGVAPASFTGVVPLLTPELWLPIAARRGGRARRHQRLGAVAGRHDAARAARLPLDVRQGPAEARRHGGSRPTPTSR